MVRVYIRKYQPGDEKAVKSLVAKGVMVTVNPFFLSAAIKEGIIQLILMASAVLFIVLGTTLRNRSVLVQCSQVPLFLPSSDFQFRAKDSLGIPGTLFLS